MLRKSFGALARHPALRLVLIALAAASIYGAWTARPVDAAPLSQGAGTRRAGEGTATPEEEPIATPSITVTATLTVTPSVTPDKDTDKGAGSGTRRAGQGVPQSATPTVESSPEPTPTATPARRAPTPAAQGQAAVVTVNRAGNLRAGPGSGYAVVGAVQAGDRLTVVAASVDGNWLLTDDDAWIAAFLVDGAPEDLPVADVIVPPTPTPTATERPTVTPTATPVATATPAPGQGIVLTVKSTSNLRGGPGTNYPIVGGAAPGDRLVGVGRTADAGWVLLDSDAWIAAFLVDGAVADLPVVQVQAAAAPVPVQAGDAATERYLNDVAAYLNVYVIALEGMDRLLVEAVATPADALGISWLQRMGTMLETILLTNDQIRRIQPPPGMVPVHQRLLAAADYFERGAIAIANGIAALDSGLIISGFEDFGLAAAELDAASRLLP